VAAFFADAVAAVSKNPYRFLERVQTALSARTLLEVPQGDGQQLRANPAEMDWKASPQLQSGASSSELFPRGVSSGPEFGPLVVCTLENCLKVVAAGQSEGEKKGLTSKPGGLGLVKKTGIAMFTAAASKQLMVVQRDPKALAAVIDNILEEIEEVSEHLVRP
jgi:hypothetical protein